MEFEAGNYKGLTAFVGFIEQIMAHDQDLLSLLLSEDCEFFVRVMTVRGLEFPFVWPDADRQTFQHSGYAEGLCPFQTLWLGADYSDIAINCKVSFLIKEAIKLNVVQLKIRRNAAPDVSKN